MLGVVQPQIGIPKVVSYRALVPLGTICSGLQQDKSEIQSKHLGTAIAV